ncbi:hypothetical protein GXW74_06425 [Roseomonas eburnea]|uniref:Uncharacterized protein n=1 Tax=Neoroseomonas eburnea TaxID=1346889 RepID=A0A9X9X8S9_9PROT|nr:hypothetical protein [Neoroseomonas eburnea]MBR0680115.1 hypothetical protein [Neoroseomonas eburnea]
MKDRGNRFRRGDGEAPTFYISRGTDPEGRIPVGAADETLAAEADA